MKLHPSFRHHLPPQASTRKNYVEEIMRDEPIELPFIKAKLTLWQRIKRMIR